MEYEITGEVRNLRVHAARGNSKIWVFFEIDGVKLRGEFNDIPVDEGELAARISSAEDTQAAT